MKNWYDSYENCEDTLGFCEEQMRMDNTMLITIQANGSKIPANYFCKFTVLLPKNQTHGIEIYR